MPRRPIGDHAMSATERSQRAREKLRGGLSKLITRPRAPLPKLITRPGTSRAEIGRLNRQRGRNAEAADRGALFQRLTAETDGDTMLRDLTVLGEARDPYRVDTPAGRRIGHWFANQMTNFVPMGTVHLRGFHYCLAADGTVRKPNGQIYLNNELDWAWLSEVAATRARWLGYVPFERIVDERNEPPEVLTLDAVLTDDTWLVPGHEALVPDADELMPYPACQTDPRQPFRIILVGEKSSLRPVLLPFAQTVAGELILPSGDISDLLIYGMVNRAADDDRRTVVLYLSDFDPSGYFMPSILSRKLQALRDLEFPDLDIAVYPVALNFEQASGLNLPSTPLKETERRADKWKPRWGREQTEIDALAALRPDVLRDIVRDALTPFFDFGLEARIVAAEQQWRNDADVALQADPRYAGAKALVDVTRSRLGVTAEALSRVQDAAHEILSKVSLPAFEPPKPEFTAEAPEALFDSDDDWAPATQKLKKYRQLGDADETA